MPLHIITATTLPIDDIDVEALLIDDPDLLEQYNHDQYTSLKGEATHLARPKNELEVAALLAWAHEGHLPVTIVGRKTSFVGGGTPMGRKSVYLGSSNASKDEGGPVLGQKAAGFSGTTDASRSPDVEARVLAISTEMIVDLEVKAEQMSAVVGPGVLQGDLWQACAAERTRAAPQGLLFPPDPTSRDDASVGGGIACNASGARTFKYGMSRAWVQGLRALLATGELLELDRGSYFFDDNDELELVSPNLGRVVLKRPSYETPGGKQTTGYYSRPEMDLVDLLVGEEGTLVVLTETTVKLTPQPTGRFQLMVAFDEWIKAIGFVDMARSLPHGERPAALEWMDGVALGLMLEEQPQQALIKDSKVEAIIVVEVELPARADIPSLQAEMTDELLMSWAERLEEFSPLEVLTATTGAQIERFRLMRHAVPSTVNEIVSRRGLFKLGTDTRVSFEHFADYMLWCRKHIRELGVQGVSYGHVGDAHVHFNLLPRTEAEVPAAKQAYHDLAARAVKLGGTVSAEHGIGKVKHQLLELQVGAQGIEQMRRLKAQFDPHGILGPGNLFD